MAGQEIAISQKTAYPWDGDVELSISPEHVAEWTLALRIPGWCRGAELTVNGEAVDLVAVTRHGYAHLTREWKDGDRVFLRLPMPVAQIEARPDVRQNCGRAALQRGPVVYCLEETDNGPNLNDVCLPEDPLFSVTAGQDGILAGIPLVHARARRRDTADWGANLYRPCASQDKECTLTAIPYYLWANREPGEMLVWVRTATARKGTL